MRSHFLVPDKKFKLYNKINTASTTIKQKYFEQIIVIVIIVFYLIDLLKLYDSVQYKISTETLILRNG